MLAPDPRHPRRSQADFPLIGLSEFGRPSLYSKYLFYLIRNEDKPMGVVDAAWGFENNLVGWWP
jgi:hypothetical protein